MYVSLFSMAENHLGKIPHSLVDGGRWINETNAPVHRRPFVFASQIESLVAVRDKQQVRDIGHVINIIYHETEAPSPLTRLARLLPSQAWE